MKFPLSMYPSLQFVHRLKQETSWQYTRFNVIVYPCTPLTAAHEIGAYVPNVIFKHWLISRCQHV